MNNRALWICQPILIVWMIDTVDKAIHVLCTSTWGRSSAALLLWQGVWILYYLFYVFRDLIILLMETRDVPTLVENTRWEKKLWSQSYTCKIFAIWTASGHKKFTLLPWPVAIDEGRVENWNLCHSFLLFPYPMLFSCFTSTSW